MDTKLYVGNLPYSTTEDEMREAFEAFGRAVRAAESAFRTAAGTDPRPWFRCPFGAGAGSARVVDRLAGLGYRDVGWHVDGRDWAGDPAGRLAAKLWAGLSPIASRLDGRGLNLSSDLYRGLLLGAFEAGRRDHRRMTGQRT